MEIEYLSPNIDFSQYQALVITSKYALWALEKFDYNLWKDIPLYLIAPKTAKIAEEIGGNIAFIGKTDNGTDFANEIYQLVKNKKILYLRGEKKVSNLSKILNCDEAIFYQAICKNNQNKKSKDSKKLPEHSTIIFTSPSTVECFFKNYIWQNNFKALTIGKTTAKYLPNNITSTIVDNKILSTIREL